MSADRRGVVDGGNPTGAAARNLEAAARAVDAFLDPKDAGPPFKFDGKRLSPEAELALLSMHDYLNDVEASRG